MTGFELGSRYSIYQTEYLSKMEETNMNTHINKAADLDVIVVGCGFAGIHILHELIKRNYKVHLFDDGKEPGGTWDKNHYPGARVDSEVWVYQFTDPELWKEFTFTEKYPTWEELSAYFNFVADKWGVRPYMTFSARVDSASFDEASAVWRVGTSDGKTHAARFLVLALGSTTTPLAPPFAGADTFKGPSFHTARWPEGASMNGKRVAIIGTGASGVQVVQEAARVAEHVTVFQRTPNLALPMRLEKYTAEEYGKMRPLFVSAMARSKQTFGGSTYDFIPKPWKDMCEEERQHAMRTNWDLGGFNFWLGTSMDLFFDEACNRAHYDYWRDQTRKLIKKEHLIELLAPTEPPHPFGMKRPCLQQWYFETFNQDNVDLVDINANAIEKVTETGIIAGGNEYEVDMIVYAIGFDTCTGAISAIDIRNGNGPTIGDLWKKESLTYLGKAVPGYPNMLYTYGLQSPTALLNGPTAGEGEGDWIVSVIEDMDKLGIRRFEANRKAAEAWGRQCAAVANKTLFPKAKSWYMAANVPGKRPEMQAYCGGQLAYFEALDDEKKNNYPNFVLAKHTDTTLAE